MAKMKDLLIDAITNCPLEMLIDELSNRLQQTNVFKGRTNADQYSIHGAMEELRDALHNEWARGTLVGSGNKMKFKIRSRAAARKVLDAEFSRMIADALDMAEVEELKAALKRKAK
jgi:hypothetical protein